MQTCQDWEQIIIEDVGGVGIENADAILQDQTGKGEYVWVFDDDEIVTNEIFIDALKSFAAEHSNPEVIRIESQRGKFGIIGEKEEMACGNIGSINVVVRNDIWMKYRHTWGKGHYGSDWDFIKAMIDGGVKFEKMEGLMLKAQRVSRGLPE
jgi:hypothetical protein